MPIEIKELHIKVAVNSSQCAQTPQAQNTVSAGKGGSVGDMDAVVAECVEQVLQILQDKAER